MGFLFPSLSPFMAPVLRDGICGLAELPSGIRLLPHLWPALKLRPHEGKGGLQQIGMPIWLA